MAHELLPTIVAEDVPLVLLFQNIIGNAIKYRRADELPSIRVSARRENGAWRFSIADNGIGIQAQFLQGIFLL